MSREMFIGREAGEIIRLVASVCLSKFKVKGQDQRLSSRCHFSRVFISRGVQNGCVCNLLFLQRVWHLQSITLLIFIEGQGKSGKAWECTCTGHNNCDGTQTKLSCIQRL